jgi:hypothetical protein
MGSLVNEDFNLCRKGESVFSPISYLIHNQQQSDPSIKPALIQVLRSYGSNDVNYHEYRAQSEGLTRETAPHVDREHARRRLLEQNAIEDEQRQRAVTIDDEERRRWIAIEDSERQTMLRIKQEDENMRKRLAFEAHGAKLTYQRERPLAQNTILKDSATSSSV